MSVVHDRAQAVLDALNPDVRQALFELVGSPQKPSAKSRYRGPHLNGDAAHLYDAEWCERQYLHAGRSMSDIAAELCVDAKTVRGWLMRHGIAIRVTGQQARMRADNERASRSDDLLKALAGWVEQHGQVPTQMAWDTSRPADMPTHKTYRNIFGSWTAALTAAGIETPARHYEDQLLERREETKALVVAALSRWAEEHGRAPSIAEWNSHRPDGLLSDKGVRHLFGCWAAAVEAAGLDPNRLGWRDPDRAKERRESQKRAFVDGIRAWVAEHDGEVPTSIEWQSDRPDKTPGVAVVRGLFGTWPAAVRAAGLQPLRPGEKKNTYHSTPSGPKPQANRQMVTGKGLRDQRLGTVKHFGRGMRATA